MFERFLLQTKLVTINADESSAYDCKTIIHLNEVFNEHFVIIARGKRSGPLEKK